MWCCRNRRFEGGGMKSADATILILPGFAEDDGDHWYQRWHSGMKTARRVELADPLDPGRDAYVGAVTAAVIAADRPVVLVAHSLGVLAAVHAAPTLPADRVRGAFLAGIPDLERHGAAFERAVGYLPVPRDPLPFPSLAVVSRTDPWCSFEVAEDLAGAWGSRVIDVGDSGHLDADSGHGPWPEGLMTFGKFLSRLQPA